VSTEPNPGADRLTGPKAADRLIAGSRMSALARTQTQSVLSLLSRTFPETDFDLQFFSTRGDVETSVPLPSIGGKGLFTERLEQALRDGEIDIAVHSLKDLPVDSAAGLTLGAILGRTDASDVLVTRDGRSLEAIPAGGVVGTSSTRRQAQILAVRPDLQVKSVRGNVETRVAKVESGEYDAIILAAAGLKRLGVRTANTVPLQFGIMLPAPGQGALAVQCRADDARVLGFLAAIDDGELRRAVEAERQFLKGLGGGCSAPVAAFAEMRPISAVSAGGPSQVLHLRGRVMAADGSSRIDVEGSGEDAGELGRSLAARAVEQGALRLISASVQEVTAGADSAASADAALPLNDRSAAPLAGRRIVVTRAAGQDLTLVRELEALGARPVQVPTIRIVPEEDRSALQAAIRAGAGFAWITFASVNGVEQYLAEAAALGIAQAVPTGVRVAAVGSVTAEFLRARGIEVNFVPATFTGRALGQELPVDAGARILVVTARDGSHDAEEGLAARGANVTRLSAYHTESVVPTETQLQAIVDGVDAVLFTSGSTVRGFAQALGADSQLEAKFARMRPAVCCIGPSTAAAARELGFVVDVEAAEHTVRGLIDQLVAYFGGTKHES